MKRMLLVCLLLLPVSAGADGISVGDLYPAALPDLFKGSQIVQFGRYSASGEEMVTLSGTANGEPMSFSRQVWFPAEAPENDFLPRLWATRKVGFLLDQIRLNGISLDRRSDLRVDGRYWTPKIGREYDYDSFPFGG